MPYLVDLTPEGRRGALKMGPRSVDFVSRALYYARTKPQFKPAFVDLAEFQLDLDAINTLRDLQGPLSKLANMVDDSDMLAGSDAYGAALATYDAIKSAAKRGMPDAVEAASDLAARLPARGASRAAPKPPVAGGGVGTAATGA